jgi:hypothetical protein
MDQKTIKTAVEAAWRQRAQVQHLKPNTSAYRVREQEFIAGAMSAIQVTDPDAAKNTDRLSALVPVGWVIALMSGQRIVADAPPEPAPAAK